MFDMNKQDRAQRRKESERFCALHDAVLAAGQPASCPSDHLSGLPSNLWFTIRANLEARDSFLVPFWSAAFKERWLFTYDLKGGCEPPNSKPPTLNPKTSTLLPKP